jgi:hypothetical protein
MQTETVYRGPKEDMQWAMIEPNCWVLMNWRGHIVVEIFGGASRRQCGKPRAWIWIEGMKQPRPHEQRFLIWPSIRRRLEREFHPSERPRGRRRNAD